MKGEGGGGGGADGGVGEKRKFITKESSRTTNGSLVGSGRYSD